MVRIAIALLASISVLSMAAGPAAAAPVGKDGKIRACYRVKGKPKGALRVLVRGKRCKRGERMMTWISATPSTGAGSTGGQPGSTGPSGQNGAPGTSGSSNEAASLAAQIASLTQRLEALEAILKGITNAALLEAVGLVPAVGALCQQASGLTSAYNALTTGIEGIAIVGNPLLGLDFGTLPSSLSAFSCP